MLRKFRVVDMLTGTVMHNFRHFQWCSLGQMLIKWKCISSNLLMSLLCLNVCRLYVPNIMTLSACFKKFHFVNVGAFAWYACSVKIGIIFCVWFERRKVDKKSKPTWKLKVKTLFWSLLNISAKCHRNQSIWFWAIPFQSLCIFWDAV